MIRLAVLALAACGPTATIYQRTSPVRVTVAKQASPAELVFAARFVAPGTVELVSKHARDVRLTRTVHYNSIATELRRPNLLYELVMDLPLGLVGLLAGPGLWETPNLIAETPVTKYVVHTNYVLAALNPFQGGVTYSARINPNPNVEIFADPPVLREFRMSLPAPAVTLAYRALDDQEQVIATGNVKTDELGRVKIAGVTGAIALEITTGRTVMVLPIEPSSPR